MKIKEITDEKIIFDNGNYLTFHHNQDCCEWVYADFEHIQVVTNLGANCVDSNELEFDEELEKYIAPINSLGFIIEDKHGIKLFVSCYNRQNGYYSSDLELQYFKMAPTKIIIDISNCVQDDIN